MTHRDTLLQIKNLKTYFPIKGGIWKRKIGQIKAVDDVSFDIYKGETLGIVGESGSGKSTLARTMLRLIEPTAGEIIFEGVNLTHLSHRQLTPYRKNMQMIFQDPYASLNPRMTIGNLVDEPILTRNTFSNNERTAKVNDLLEKVGLPRSAKKKYPHSFSGGQRQRIAIARALAMNPKFVIGDEPVSSLDVSVQAQVLNLLNDLQSEFNLTYMFISHDLNVVKHISDRVGVMYLGHIVEIGPKRAIFDNPLHPYTKALLAAIPNTYVDEIKRGSSLAGEAPSPSNSPTGCTFHTRCPLAHDRCLIDQPQLIHHSDGHYVACHLYPDNKT